jgi:predicted phosphodiesterase
MKTIRFIGDTHGSFAKYVRLIGHAKQSIQVGDFGIGFGMEDHLHKINSEDHRFIRGNHDDPQKCKMLKHFMHDGLDDNGMFFVGGAKSIDAGSRYEGVDWWKDEEVSYQESCELLHEYEVSKPYVVVSHDCPTVALKANRIQSMTSQLLDAMWEIHKPKFWIFGHHHFDKIEMIDGCTFVCVYNNPYDFWID